MKDLCLGQSQTRWCRIWQTRLIEETALSQWDIPNLALELCIRWRSKKLPLLLKVYSFLQTSRYSPVSLVVSCAAQSAKPQTMVDLQKISHHQWGKRVESYQWTIFRSMATPYPHYYPIPSHLAHHNLNIEKRAPVYQERHPVLI